ncbi:hypothetical protein [Microlunatus speluncae]|uniref:hypothetical protein n=1 Tax=Microlunatus speluncae TaxID=2594267 RepID=UPI0012662B5F|nr:hypothetical protein [Microlunatus speluncae]
MHARRRDAGTATLEYLGALAMVAVLVISVVGSPVIESADIAVRNAICRLIKAVGTVGANGQPITCDEAPPGEPGQPTFDPKPDRCTVTKRTEKVSSVIKIAFIEIGDNAGFIETTYSDGTVAYTATDGGSAGVTGGFGAELDIGKLSAGAQVDFGAGVEFDYGSTWIFKNADEAKSMREQLDQYLIEQETLKHDTSGGYAIYLAIKGATDPPKPPDQNVSTIKVDANVTGELGVNLPWEQKDKSQGDDEDDGVPGLDLARSGIKFGASNTWTQLTDNRNGDTIWTTNGEVYGELTGQLGPFGKNLSGLLGSSLAITRNKDGKITRVTITTTRKGQASDSTKVGQGNLGGEGKDENGTGGTTVTTTMLKITDDQQRAVVDAWLANGGVVSPETAFPDQLVPNDTLQNLMYTNATVSNVEYDNVIDKTGFAAEVKIGIAFGVDFSLETEDSRAVDATYLGTPASDGFRTPVTFKECIAK